MSGLTDRGTLLNETAACAAGRTVDAMRMGLARGCMDTPYARRPSGANAYIGGGANIIA